MALTTGSTPARRWRPAAAARAAPGSAMPMTGRGRSFARRLGSADGCVREPPAFGSALNGAACRSASARVTELVRSCPRRPASALPISSASTAKAPTVRITTATGGRNFDRLIGRCRFGAERAALLKLGLHRCLGGRAPLLENRPAVSDTAPVLPLAFVAMPDSLQRPRCYVASPLGFTEAGRDYYARVYLPALATVVIRSTPGRWTSRRRRGRPRARAGHRPRQRRGDPLLRRCSSPTSMARSPTRARSPSSATARRSACAASGCAPICARAASRGRPSTFRWRLSSPTAAARCAGRCRSWWPRWQA